MIEISLNKEADKETFLNFFELKVGGVDFGKKIRDDHFDISKENYVKYIDDFYAKHNNELENILQDTKECFFEIKDILFLELGNYFKQDYSRGEYSCYLSIFDCNPRDIDSKTFQVYYKRSHNMRKEVIAHELTHFAFYDFCHKFDIKDSSALWELSEIFNVIFLNLPSMRNSIGAEEFLFYPNLKNKLEVIRSIWNKKLGTNEFIISSLQYLQNNKDKIWAESEGEGKGSRFFVELASLD